MKIFHVNAQKQPPKVLYKKKVLLKVSQNSLENTCAKVSISIKLQASTCSFTKKETLTEVLSYEFWEIFKNTFLQNTSG